MIALLAMPMPVQRPPQYARKQGVLVRRSYLPQVSKAILVNLIQFGHAAAKSRVKILSFPLSVILSIWKGATGNSRETYKIRNLVM
jgi:hypothetical protein